MALAKISKGGCCCVLMNTVKQAEQVFEKIHIKNHDAEIMLFHSRFLNKDRIRIEKECVKKYGKNSRYRPKKGILVATQVVEQSLDVDFDFMINVFSSVLKSFLTSII